MPKQSSSINGASCALSSHPSGEPDSPNNKQSCTTKVVRRASWPQMGGLASLNGLPRKEWSTPGASSIRAPISAAPVPSEPIRAGFGVEIEIDSVLVEGNTGDGRPLRQHDVLLESQDKKWKLVCDETRAGLDLEFVTVPLASKDEVREVVKEIAAVCNKIRQSGLELNKKRERESVEVQLKKLVEGMNVDLVADCQLRIKKPGAQNTLQPTGCRDLPVLQTKKTEMTAVLQTTWGVSLEKLPEMIEEVDPLYYAGGSKYKKVQKDFDEIDPRFRGIKAMTENVRNYVLKHHGLVLSKKAEGFVSLLNMYLARAQSRKAVPSGSTIHVRFRMEARSDFCSIFSKLLDDGDRSVMRKLLLPGEGETVPLMMKALRCENPEQCVFAMEYETLDGQSKQRGSTIKDWFASIINGRGEGELIKDLMSPPRGYRLHNGNKDQKDYGMGAVGVDEENGLVLFEFRGMPDRQKNLPIHEFEKRVMNEYRKALENNPSLTENAHEKIMDFHERVELNNLNAVKEINREMERDATEREAAASARYGLVNKLLGRQEKSAGQIRKERLRKFLIDKAPVKDKKDEAADQVRKKKTKDAWPLPFPLPTNNQPPSDAAFAAERDAPAEGRASNGAHTSAPAHANERPMGSKAANDAVSVTSALLSLFYQIGTENQARLERANAEKEAESIRFHARRKASYEPSSNPRFTQPLPESAYYPFLVPGANPGPSSSYRVPPSVTQPMPPAEALPPSDASIAPRGFRARRGSITESMISREERVMRATLQRDGEGYISPEAAEETRWQTAGINIQMGINIEED
ncbi:hypothetical protein BSIN_4249 [Burkholderia singularis]|uniref:Uncharacterized protein n=1 Tax=Burkholderia singularis TaxID=1503053 RepID=A0A238H7Z3_9BURK|nr:hypothetical protein BSIN_4249 [Burkholderia singularis]